jgi:hypothetical protein
MVILNLQSTREEGIVAKSTKLVKDMLEFASRVDQEGYHEVARVFRSAAVRYCIETCLRSIPEEPGYRKSSGRLAANSQSF